MRQGGRIDAIIFQLRRRDRFHPLRMDQTQLDARTNRFAKRRPETAGLDRRLHRSAKLRDVATQGLVLIPDVPGSQQSPPVIYRRDVTKSLVKIYAYVVHSV